jgi:hypothetical protein
VYHVGCAYYEIILPVVITRYFTIRKEHRLRGVQNRMQGKTFGPKRIIEKTAH